MFKEIFTANSWQNWLIALGIIVGGVIVGRVVYWICKTKLRKVTAKTKNRFDGLIIDMVEEPAMVVIVLAGIWLGLGYLNLPMQIDKLIGNAFNIVIVIVAAWVLTRFVDAFFKEFVTPLADKTDSTLDNQILPLIRKAIKIAIWVGAIVIGLDNAGYDVGALLAGLGIGGLAFAMAAKDTVSNLFGGFTVFVDKPFTVGDRIVVAGFDGTVSEIGIRSTRLKTLANRTVTIPNSTFQNGIIENISSEPSRKVVLNLGLTYDMNEAQVEQAISILKDINAKNGSTEDDSVVAFDAFGDFALNILFVYFIKKGEDIMGTQTAVNLEILKQFNANGLEMAFPTQTVLHKAM